MKRTIALPLLLLLLTSMSPAVRADAKLSVLVKTVALASHTLVATLTGYGTVLPDPDKVVSVNLPHAGQVTKLWVSQGQVVTRGMPLLELDTDPAARMKYIQAKAAVDYARSEVQRVKQMLAEQLATKSQLAGARKALADALAVLNAEKKLGTGRTHDIIRAPFNGIVSALQVAQGQRIQAGTTALNLARRNALLIPLGVEPEDAARVRPGMTVELTPVFDPRRAILAKVDEVNGMINPATLLVNVVVRLHGPQTKDLLLGMRVKGAIITTTERALAVPRSAILRDRRGAYLFVVQNGRARRVNVQTGLEYRGLVAVQGPLQAGERVVVLGNYELRDGTAVRETGP